MCSLIWIDGDMINVWENKSKNNELLVIIFVINTSPENWWASSSDQRYAARDFLNPAGRRQVVGAENEIFSEMKYFYCYQENDQAADNETWFRPPLITIFLSRLLKNQS